MTLPVDLFTHTKGIVILPNYTITRKSKACHAETSS